MIKMEGLKESSLQNGLTGTHIQNRKIKEGFLDSRGLLLRVKTPSRKFEKTGKGGSKYKYKRVPCPPMSVYVWVIVSLV